MAMAKTTLATSAGLAPEYVMNFVTSLLGGATVCAAAETNHVSSSIPAKNEVASDTKDMRVFRRNNAYANQTVTTSAEPPAAANASCEGVLGPRILTWEAKLRRVMSVT